MDFYSNLPLCKPGLNEKRYDFYFAVIVHVPSFTAEQVVLLPDVTGMEIDVLEASSSETSRQYKSWQSVESTASMVKLGESKGSVCIPAVELRSISAQFYWRENS